MYRYSLILLLTVIPFVSCKSLPQSEELLQKEIQMPQLSGEISSYKIIDNHLIIESDPVLRIAYALKSNESDMVLSKADNYRYKYKKRPDGSINTLIMYQMDEQIVWISEGLREGDVFNDITVAPSEGIDSINLKSSDKEWTIPADTETVIDWGEGDYIAYASQISKGKMVDQPPFRCNLILLKK